MRNNMLKKRLGWPFNGNLNHATCPKPLPDFSGLPERAFDSKLVFDLRLNLVEKLQKRLESGFL